MVDQPVILITGASSGIGAAAARLFGREGYRVVLAARRQELLEKLKNEIESEGGKALAIQSDVKCCDDCQRLARQALENYGQIDILFNNAGIGRLDWLESLDLQTDIQELISVNLLGTIWLTRAVLPAMIERQSGHIINMVSVAGLIAPPLYTIYSASKFGVRGFSDALRREVRIHNIFVSGVYPGGVKNDFASEYIRKRKTGIHTPKWLALSNEDVARGVWSLACRPRRMIVLPGYFRLAYAFTLLFPGLVDRAIETIFTRREMSG